MFEVPQFFVGTDCTWALSELSADSSEEPTCRLRPSQLGLLFGHSLPETSMKVTVGIGMSDHIFT